MIEAPQAHPTVTTYLPGAAIIRRVHRLILLTIGAALVYSMFLGASKGGCAGGTTAGGSFVDQYGNATDAAPLCVSLTLRPSILMYLIFAGVLLGALTRVLRRAADESSALRILNRAAVAIPALAVTAIVVANVWFSFIPLFGIDDSGTYIWPFPFGSVDYRVEPAG